LGDFTFYHDRTGSTTANASTVNYLRATIVKVDASLEQGLAQIGTLFTVYSFTLS
jgi:hypothetical protein